MLALYVGSEDTYFNLFCFQYKVFSVRQPGQKYHPFHHDSVKRNNLLLTFASKFLLQIARFQPSRRVTDDERSLSGVRR